MLRKQIKSRLFTALALTLGLAANSPYPSHGDELSFSKFSQRSPTIEPLIIGSLLLSEKQKKEIGKLFPPLQLSHKHKRTLEELFNDQKIFYLDTTFFTADSKGDTLDSLLHSKSPLKTIAGYTGWGTDSLNLKKSPSWLEFILGPLGKNYYEEAFTRQNILLSNVQELSKNPQMEDAVHAQLIAAYIAQQLPQAEQLTEAIKGKLGQLRLAQLPESGHKSILVYSGMLLYDFMKTIPSETKLSDKELTTIVQAIIKALKEEKLVIIEKNLKEKRIPWLVAEFIRQYCLSGNSIDQKIALWEQVAKEYTNKTFKVYRFPSSEKGKEEQEKDLLGKSEGDLFRILPHNIRKTPQEQETLKARIEKLVNALKKKGLVVLSPTTSQTPADDDHIESVLEKHTKEVARFFKLQPEHTKANQLFKRLKNPDLEREVQEITLKKGDRFFFYTATVPLALALSSGTAIQSYQKRRGLQRSIAGKTAWMTSKYISFLAPLIPITHPQESWEWISSLPGRSYLAGFLTHGSLSKLSNLSFTSKALWSLLAAAYTGEKDPEFFYPSNLLKSTFNNVRKFSDFLGEVRDEIEKTQKVLGTRAHTMEEEKAPLLGNDNLYVCGAIISISVLSGIFVGKLMGSLLLALAGSTILGIIGVILFLLWSYFA